MNLRTILRTEVARCMLLFPSPRAGTGGGGEVKGEPHHHHCRPFPTALQLFLECLQYTIMSRKRLNVAEVRRSGRTRKDEGNAR